MGRPTDDFAAANALKAGNALKGKANQTCDELGRLRGIGESRPFSRDVRGRLERRTQVKYYYNRTPPIIRSSVQ